MKKLLLVIFLVLCSVIVIWSYTQIDNNTVNTAQTAQPIAEHLKPFAFQDTLNKGGYELLDIRTMEEYNTGHIKGAVQIDFYQTAVFTQYLESLDKNKKYLLYCRSGNRSGKAITMMKAMGFKNVADLNGGINAWTTNKLPIEK